MSRYFKAAFLLGWNVPGLGRVPVNLLAVLGFGILGFGEHAFWLLGMGLEAGFLTTVATNARFQRLVDGQSRVLSAAATKTRRQEIVAQLSRESRDRLSALEQKCGRALAVYREAQADAYVIEGNRDALDRLAWIYLKLLVARDHLEATQKQVNQADLERRIDQLEQALADPAQTSGSLRESQQATLKLLQQRLLNLARSRKTLEEVASDLERIEAQVDLVLDSASLHGPAEILPGTIELASQLLVGEGDYGESGDAVSALDEVYRARQAAAGKQGA